MSYLCIAFVTLVLVTVVGHGMWLLVAHLYRLMVGEQQHGSTLSPSQPNVGLKPKPKRRADCVRCGAELHGVLDCPRCGLDNEGYVAEELVDLEATARQLERFQRNQALPAELLQQIWQLVHERHERMLGTPKEDVPVSRIPPMPVPEPPKEKPTVVHPEPTPLEKPSTWVPVEKVAPQQVPTEDIPSVVPVPEKVASEEAPWQRLMQLLEKSTVADMTPSERVKLVLWFRQTSPNQIDTFSRDNLKKLTEALQLVGLVDEVFRVGRLCVKKDLAHPQNGALLMELVRLAEEKAPNEVTGLVNLARTAVLNDTEKAQLSKLSGIDLTHREEEFVVTLAEEEPATPVTPISQPTSATPVTPILQPTSTPSTPAPVKPVAKKRNWSDLMAGFMEEKNILWGELVGGLLIVGGSVALVISLWNTLEQNPYFPFGIFSGITLALFAAALYTLSHWKLTSTSRGLMVIATLLVPLAFLVMPRMLNKQSDELVEIAISAVTLSLFGYCLYRVGQTLTSTDHWLLPVAVLGGAVGQIITVRSLGSEQPPLAGLLLLTAVPSIGFLLANWRTIHRLRPPPELTLTKAGELFAVLGLTTFSFAVAFIFLLARVPEKAVAVRQLAILVSPSAAPMVFGGLLIHHRLQEANWRTVGTCVLFAGIGFMVLAVILAWPMPLAVLAVGGFNFVVLSWLAFRYRLPMAHIPALACLAVSCLMIFALGESAGMTTPRLLQHLGTMSSALVLAVMSVAVVHVSGVLARIHLEHHSKIYDTSALVLSALAVVVASWNGWNSPLSASITYILAAWVTAMMNYRWRRDWLAYTLGVLVIGVSLWGAHAFLPGAHAQWSIVLAAVALLLLLSGLIALRSSWFRYQGRPLYRCAELAVAVAIGLAVWSGFRDYWLLEYAVLGLMCLGLFMWKTYVDRHFVDAFRAGLALSASAILATGWYVTWSASGRLLESVTLSLGIVFLIQSVYCLVIRQLGWKELPNRAWFVALVNAWKWQVVPGCVLVLVLACFRGFPLTWYGHTYTLLALSAIAWIWAGFTRQVGFSWVGSTFLLFGVFQHLYVAFPKFALGDVVGFALLIHASIQTGIFLVLWLRVKPDSSVYRLFAKPLVDAGMVSTFVFVPLLSVAPILIWEEGNAKTLTTFFTWVAGLWLIVSVVCDRRWLFALFQGMATVSVCCMVTVWLTGQSWTGEDSILGYLDPRSLQAYGIGLGLLSGGFVLARIGLGWTPRGKNLLLPNWPGVDRFLLWGLLLAQLGLTDWAILRGILTELKFTAVTRFWPDGYFHAYGIGVWWLLGLLSAVMLLSLWQPAPDNRQRSAVRMLPLLAMTLAAIVAGQFAKTGSVSVVFLWMLAASYLAGSALLWMRTPLVRFGRGLRIPETEAVDLPRQLRIRMLDGFLLPIALLSLVILALNWNGVTISVQGQTEWLQSFGFSILVLGPLVLVSLVMVGQAIRESSAAYIFSAGWVLTFCIANVYYIDWLDRKVFAATEWVHLLQLVSLCAAVWGCAWFSIRRSVVKPAAWQPPFYTRVIMQVQALIPMTVQAALLMAGLVMLTDFLAWDATVPSTTASYPVLSQTGWTISIGGWLGWAALALTLLAIGLLHQHGLRLWWLMPGGLLLIGQLACTVEGWQPGYGYRTFMLGMGGVVLLWTALSLLLGEKTFPGRKSVFRYVVFELFIVLLSLQATFVHQDRLFAAGALGLSGSALVVLGLSRRQDAPLIFAGYIFNLGLSLTLWHFYMNIPFLDWVVTFVHATALVGWLIVLGLFTLTGETEDKKQNLGRLLQTGWSGLLVLGPLAVYFYHLCQQPGGLPTNFMSQQGSLLAWCALLFGGLALVWGQIRTNTDRAARVLPWLGVLLALQVSASVHGLSPNSWLAYHTFELGLVVLGFVLLILGVTGSGENLTSPGFFSEEGKHLWVSQVRLLFPHRHTRWWLGGLIAALTVFGFGSAFHDPSRPFWPAVIVSLSAGLSIGVVFWTRRNAYVHLTAALIGLVGIIVWLSLNQGSTGDFIELIYLSILSLSVATLLATAAEMWLQYTKSETEKIEHVSLPMLAIPVLLLVFLFFVHRYMAIITEGMGDFRMIESFWHLQYTVIVGIGIVCLILLVQGSFGKADGKRISAGLACSFMALNLLSVMVLLSVAGFVRREEVSSYLNYLAWPSWGLLAVAILFRSRMDLLSKSRLSGLPVYVCGVLGLALVFLYRNPTSENVPMFVVLLLAGYTCAASLFRLLFSARLRPLLWLSPTSQLPPQNWFAPIQIISALTVLGLSFYLCCSGEEFLLRLSGPLSLALLVFAAAWLTAVEMRNRSASSEPFFSFLRYVTLALFGLFLLALSWSVPEPDRTDILLMRSALAMTVISLCTLIYGGLLRRLLQSSPGWEQACSRLGQWSWLLGAVSVVAVIGQEAGSMLPDFPAVSISPLVAGMVAVAVVGFVVSGVWFALQPQRDLFRLSSRWRTVYVYGAEIFLALLVVHFRLSFPDLFRSKFMSTIWPFAVMGLAFFGIGISELCQRWKLNVLAEPLRRTAMFLPVLPLLAYWVAPVSQSNAVDSGLAPLSTSTHAFVWHLTGVLFLLLAMLRRSGWFALTAALAMNFGLWTMLSQYDDLRFLQHPQMWLIPLALILLVAEHLNRDRLSFSTSLTLRYTGLLLLYVSSTADLFLNGLESIVLSLVLAVLSILGILAGIHFRVRAFLLSGIVFLVLVIGARIWYAAVDQAQTWVWWVSVILLGAVILALFALFEKRRMDVLKVVEEFKHWK